VPFIPRLSTTIPRTAVTRKARNSPPSDAIFPGFPQRCRFMNGDDGEPIVIAHNEAGKYRRRDRCFAIFARTIPVVQKGTHLVFLWRRRWRGACSTSLKTNGPLMLRAGELCVTRLIAWSRLRRPIANGNFASAADGHRPCWTASGTMQPSLTKIPYCNRASRPFRAHGKVDKAFRKRTEPFWPEAIDQRRCHNTFRACS
jgi:hypothetical protein